MKINGNIISAEEGKVLRRKSDYQVFGDSISLGYTYYLNGELLDTPLLELPEHYEEIDDPEDKNNESDANKGNREPEHILDDYRNSEEYKNNLLLSAKNQKAYEIDKYDKSDDVNAFFYNGKQYWLSRETRVSVMNTANILAEAGDEEMTLWLGDTSITLAIASVKMMLSALERYAFYCYNATANHKAAVMSLESIEDVEAYNYKTGYPEKLRF